MFVLNFDVNVHTALQPVDILLILTASLNCATGPTSQSVVTGLFGLFCLPLHVQAAAVMCKNRGIQTLSSGLAPCAVICSRPTHGLYFATLHSVYCIEPSVVKTLMVPGRSHKSLYLHISGGLV